MTPRARLGLGAVLLAALAAQGCPAAPAGLPTPKPTRPRVAAGTPLPTPTGTRGPTAPPASPTPAPTARPVAGLTPPPPEPGGTVSTLAGGPKEPGSADGPGATARFARPTNVVVVPGGAPTTLIVADGSNHTLRRVVIGADGQATVSTLLGQAGQPATVDGPAPTARLRHPMGLAFDARQRLWVTELEGNAIRRVAFDAAGAATIETVAGAGTGAAGADDGAGAAATFREPAGIVVDAQGTAYVADRGNNRLRKITPDGQVTTLVGLAGKGTGNGPASKAQVSGPFGLALAPGGTLYVADAGTSLLRRLAPVPAASGEPALALAAGDPAGGYADGFWDMVRFAYPSGLAVDAKGRVVVADALNHRIRRYTAPGDVETVAGSGPSVDVKAGAFQDGPSDAARFDAPLGLAVGPDGSIYVADTNNHVIRRIAPR